MSISLSKTVEFVASIANSARWTIVSDAATTATSTTVTSATAAFTTAMVGMTCTITGADTGGATLLTTFSAYISATQMTLAVAAVRTTAAATLSFGGRNVEDNRHAEPEIIEAVLEADAEECREILADPQNPRRAAFTEVVTVLAKGDQLPSRTGAVGKVEIQHADTTWRTGRMAPLFKIQRWNGDTTTFSTTTNVTDGFYDLSTGNLEYTGTSARVSTVNFTKSTSPQSPDESQSSVVARALKILFLKEGDDVQAAALLNQIGMAGLGATGRGEERLQVTGN